MCYKFFMIKRLQHLCYNFFMIKIADKPWQIILHAKLFRHSKVLNTKRFKRIKIIRNYLPLGHLSLRW